MNNALEIIPSPGTDNKNWPEIQQKIELLKLFARTIHIDVVDGKFAPNTTFSDPKPFQSYTHDTLFEVHLMVDEPSQYIKTFAEAGFKRFIGHVEKMSDQGAFVETARKYGEALFGLNMRTDISFEDLPDCDGILVMTVDAGFSGQSFNPLQLGIVENLRKHSDKPIEVDGGINNETIFLAKNAGATRFVTTSYILTAVDPKKTFEELQTIIT